jgi:HEPN domain-containing protein
MRPDTIEWVEKAEADYHSAKLLFRARKHPNCDGACFHAQQCAEKYMKAVLHEAKTKYDRTHDLPALLRKLTAINPMWVALGMAAQVLSDYAVRYRYPGNSADREMAKNAIRACEFIRSPLREHLIPPPVKKKRPEKAGKRRKKRGRP